MGHRDSREARNSVAPPWIIDSMMFMSPILISFWSRILVATHQTVVVRLILVVLVSSLTPVLFHIDAYLRNKHSSRSRHIASILLR